MIFYLAMSTLPSYQEHRGIVILFVNYVMSVVTFNMMLHNMAGKKFSVLQSVIFLLAIPLLAYHVFGVSAETEKLLTIALTGLTFIVFFVRMVCISIQWGDYSGKPFFYIRASDVKEATKKLN